MNSQVATHPHFRTATVKNLRSVDLTTNFRVQIPLGLMTAIIGFVTMCYPIVDKDWFVSTLSMCLATMSIFLIFGMIMASGSLQNLTHSLGFKRYAILIINLLITAVFITEYVELTLTYLAFSVILYFLADEWLGIVTAYRYHKFDSLLFTLLDNVLTLAALIMLVTGFELRGEPVVTLILGLKVALLGCELMLSSKSKRSY
ncbi:hypothetical protein L8R80_13670 [Vibrio splendidus]|uniref:hypothetical protein n=1 Tax=Vibrio splendidus TaxID=29497 RepID=UPI0024698D26|nr:hypothetical protein [Vibrio splendidus]MDH5911501.1 hypothetical protein [Vibrio splendidus]MDH5942714.1 hypothetical protein [Vibrio splendidus]MDH5985739.1 hypothetical protein [Vibrio splendidus]MDH5994291.1 hypothetical protein [Vibrio splendidus]MDH6006701.1 hypothetical protein [Vibrio splendidus]